MEHHLKNLIGLEKPLLLNYPLDYEEETGQNSFKAYDNITFTFGINIKADFDY